MTDIDTFENELKRVLNQSVDAQVGARRPAPPFANDRRIAPTRRGIRPWATPLLAAACVVAAAVAAIGGTHALTGHFAGPAAPATRHPVPTPSGKPHVVKLGAARLSLPTGWVARSYRLYVPSSEPLVASPSWCLTPASTPVSTAPGACPVSFGTIPIPRTSHVDPDTEGGLWGNPLYCIPRGGETSIEIRAADLPFGKRSADFRDWRFDCRDGTKWWIQQYLVVSDPGFILFSEGVTPEIAAAMRSIVSQSTLPARTSSLRYFDEGTVIESTPVAGGVRIRLKRRIFGPDQMLRAPDPAQLDYLIPLSLFRQHQNFFRPHSQVGICTDGTTVTWAFSA